MRGESVEVRQAEMVQRVSNYLKERVSQVPDGTKAVLAEREKEENIKIAMLLDELSPEGQRVLLNALAPAMGQRAECLYNAFLSRVMFFKSRRDFGNMLLMILRIFRAVGNMRSDERDFFRKNLLQGPYSYRTKEFEKQLASKMRGKVDEPEGYAKSCARFINATLSGILRGIKLRNNFLHAKSPYFPHNSSGKPDDIFWSEYAAEMVLDTKAKKGSRAKNYKNDGVDDEDVERLAEILSHKKEAGEFYYENHQY